MARFDLDTLLAPGQRLSVDEAVERMLLACEALTEDHANGVNPRLASRYPSPEVVSRSSSLDVRSDIWGLGVAFYELLAGEPPFRGTVPEEVCTQILRGTVPPIRMKLPELPLGVAAIVSRCLIKDPRARFANVAELARALLPFAPARAHALADRILDKLGDEPQVGAKRSWWPFGSGMGFRRLLGIL